MSTIVNIPLLNPIRLIQDGNPNVLRFFNSMADFEDAANFAQPFQKDDVIYFQFYSDNTGLIVSVLLNDYNSTYSKNCSAGTVEALGAGFYYQFTCSLANVPDGFYYFRVSINTVGDYQSEPIHVKTTHENTSVILYTNDQNDFGIKFSKTGTTNTNIFKIRVPGGFLTEGFNPGSKDVVFTNQSYDVTLVNSIPFAVNRFTLGHGTGVPNWLADKFNRILSCTTVEINNRQYTKTEGAKLEGKKIPLWPMAVWEIELIQKNNSLFDEFAEVSTPGYRGEGGDFNSDFNDDFNNQIAEVE